MKHKKAVEFHAGKYNCAQAVLKAFDKNDDIVAEAKSYGGGRAEDGLCGALYAGLLLTENKDKQIKLKEFFKENAASLKCREIKKQQTLSCSQCVEIVAKFLEENND